MWLWEAYNGLAGLMLGYADGPWAVAALFLFAFAESSFFPIPPDVMLIAMCLSPSALANRALVFGYAGVCTAASVVGGALGYLIGLKGGRPLLVRIFEKEKVLRVERAFQRYDVWAVAAAGFTPIPYKLFTIAGGAFRLNFARFVLASVLGRSGRFFIVAAVLALWGKPVQKFVEANFGWLSLAFFALLFAGVLVAGKLGSRASRSEEE